MDSMAERRGDGQGSVMHNDTSPSHCIPFTFLGEQRPVEVPATAAELDGFAASGYLVRSRLVTGDLLAQLRETVDEVAAGLIGGGGRFGGVCVRHCFERHPGFHPLIDYAPAVAIARAMLGPAVQVRLSARITEPSPMMQQTVWHLHQSPVLPTPLPRWFTFPHSMDVLVYLDDVDEASGALAVLPGSHQHLDRWPHEDDYADKPDQVLLLPRAGDAVFLHNNLWHRALPTRPDGRRRRMLALTYSPCWMHQVDDGASPADGATAPLRGAQAPRALRELLGEIRYRF